MKYFVLIFLGAMLFAQCNIIDGRHVKGDGNITSKTYDFKGFTSVKVSDAMDVYLRQDSGFTVKIETDGNLINLINVKVDDDNTLEIENKSDVNLSPSDEVKVFISMPRADEIRLSGASQLKTEGKFTQNEKLTVDISGASTAHIALRAPSVELEANGASTLNVNGESRDVQFKSNGASTINAYDFKTENADVGASGASTVKMFSSVSVKARASGASTVKYKGNPTISSDANGASNISKAD